MKLIMDTKGHRFTSGAKWMFKTVCLFLCLTSTVINGFDLTILHTNDVHARFQQFNKYGSGCSTDDATEGKCFGGVARRYTKVEEIRRTHDHVLFLDGGDQFMGTSWFTVYGGKAASHFMNMLGYDVMCIGNHEFDLGVGALEQFLGNVTFDVVSSNTDVSNEPNLNGLFTKTTTKEFDGESIGIIGYTTAETSKISNPGPTVSFTDVVTAVTQEVASLELQGINKIIALGHAGITIDKQVAAIDGVDIVVGGHSNTFLYNGEKPSNHDIQGPYPIVITQPGGGQGKAGNPIILDNSVVENTTILQELAKWSTEVDALNNEELGTSKVFLEGHRDVCRLEECNLGNVVTDAIVDYHVKFEHPENQWAPAAIAIWNGGGIRSSIDKGSVSMGNVLNVLPFRNEIDIVTVKGSNLREQLEYGISLWTRDDPAGAFLQVSGLRVMYDMEQPVGSRVASVEVRCLKCTIPSYSPLDDTKNYKLLVSTFLLGGGDGYNFVYSERQSFNTLDSITLVEYIRNRSPITTGIEGRIKFGSSTVSSSSVITGVPLLCLMSLLFVVFM
ncbi:5'-nucleotidase [Mactra antiquata]